MDASARKPRFVAPWLDRRGRFSPLKTVVFLFLFYPGLQMAFEFVTGTIGPRPVTEVIHGTGVWSIRFLLATLAVTPLRQIWHWGDLVHVRRMLGLASFAYALAHLVFYAADSHWDLGFVVSEMVLRLYLTVGTIALVLMIPLAVTSTDGMMRRLGGLRWRRLHQAVYVIIALAVVHFFMETKAVGSEPLVEGALMAWLLLWRAGNDHRVPVNASGLPFLVGLSAVVVVGTAIAEALWYKWVSNIPVDRVLPTNWQFDVLFPIDWASLPYLIRPAWIVAVMALVVILGGVLRNYMIARRTRRLRPA